MATVAEILAIAGAAEGSWYSVPGGSADKRYVASFANANSGLSFGVFQFDCAKNTQARGMLRAMLRDGMSADPRAAQEQAGEVYYEALHVNPRTTLKQKDVDFIDAVLARIASRAIIDRFDRDRAAQQEAGAAALIASGALAFPKIDKKGTAYDPATADYLRLQAYLIANLNRYPANRETFGKWLAGMQVRTQGSPTGMKLTAPPTMDEMHAFFRTLKIWDGTQGKYANLRQRLDPTLDRLIVARPAAAPVPGIAPR